MGKKSYLSRQIQLMSLATYDLFTDQEYALYAAIINCSNEMEQAKQMMKDDESDRWKHQLNQLSAQRKQLNADLGALIQQHRGTPRRLRIQNVIDPRKFRDKEGSIHWPPGITWWTLKLSRRIAEFESEESRLMGLHTNEVTFDKIIIKWKSLDVLEQIVLDGFIIPLLQQDGTVLEKKYRFHTASAGQLRTDKIQCLSEEMWNKIHVSLECGMDWETLNKQGGINVNKFLAYTALPSSATDPWDMSIDRCIVIRDFEAPVTGVMKYIKPDYSSVIGEQTVSINHCDGIGMMRPDVSPINFMARGPYLKGLLTPFDFIRFCRENGVEPKLQDVWGKWHDLMQEDIQVIFTESQLKLWKYYDSWDHYKQCFKRCGCHLCRTNYEESWIQDTTINYQMLQTLQDFTDEEVRLFTAKEHAKIKSITENKEAMLRTLNAEMDADEPYRKALYLYPELLREAYSRESLKAIKKRMLLDAKSGRIRCQNKRLFAIPDMYAACQFWFLNQAQPEGLLKNGEISCRVYQRYEKADVLRSPHLYHEHAIRSINHDPLIQSWFFTNGVYTSCHDLISRILQFDVDGDQLNVVVEPVIVEAAERNIQKFQVVPLFYDANKADKEILSFESMFHGLKRAHDYSGIGQVSNALTKLWNRDHPDWESAAWLCYFNNLVIDGAKTGKINSYENYPKVHSQINKATGGKRGRMPWFFQFSKNGRKNLNDKSSKKKNYVAPNRSTMNRICAAFDDIGNINLNYAGIPPFNWQMLLRSSPGKPMTEAVQLFCQLDSANISNIIEAKDVDDMGEWENVAKYDLLKRSIIHELDALCGDYRFAYPSIVRHLFTGDNMNKSSHKQMFWRVYGDMALSILESNMTSCTICKSCGTKVPSWVEQHICQKTMKGFIECVDCGKLCERLGPRQCRCSDCQTAYRSNYHRALLRSSYQRKKGA